MSKGENVTVDHLTEARRLAQHAGGGNTWRILDNLRDAVIHLADAIEELRPNPADELVHETEDLQLSNGWGIRKSKPLQSGEEKLMDAIQTQWNELCERRATQ